MMPGVICSSRQPWACLQRWWWRTKASPGRSRASWARTAASTSRSASATGLPSGFVSARKRCSEKYRIEMASAVSASPWPRVRSSAVIPLSARSRSMRGGLPSPRDERRFPGRVNSVAGLPLAHLLASLDGEPAPRVGGSLSHRTATRARSTLTAHGATASRHSGMSVQGRTPWSASQPWSVQTSSG